MLPTPCRPASVSCRAPTHLLGLPHRLCCVTTPELDGTIGGPCCRWLAHHCLGALGGGDCGRPQPPPTPTLHDCLQAVAIKFWQWLLCTGHPPLLLLMHDAARKRLLPPPPWVLPPIALAGAAQPLPRAAAHFFRQG